MGTAIAHPESEEKLAALEAFMKVLKISFEEEKVLITRNLFKK